MWSIIFCLLRGRCEDLCINELLDRYFDVAANLPEQRGGDISTRMHWDCGHTSVRVSKLFVRAALPDFDEPSFLQSLDNLARL
jgi:hypothetical protein